MNVKTARKIGFFAALSICLGSVIGIGIFLKNISVIKAQMIDENTFSFWSLIVSWILASIISLSAAYSFSEISSSKVGKSGLSGWIGVLGGEKQGWFAKIAHSSIYFSILCSVIPILAVEGLFTAINKAVNGANADPIPFYWVFLSGMLILVLLSCFNYFSIENSAKFQIVGTISKIIPLVLVIIIGFIGANNSHILDRPDLVTPNINGNGGINTETGLPVIGVPVSNSFNLSGVFLSLPAILFSFDSFLVVGNLGNDVKNPQKTVPLVAVVTIIISAIVYVSISIAAGLTGTGDAAGIISTIIGKSNQTAIDGISITINILITLSAIFVTNAISMGTLRSCESLVEDKKIMFHSFFNKLNEKRENLGGLTLYAIQIMFYIILFGIPSVVMNNDAILDSATNAPVVIFFLVYAYTMILGIKDRYTKKQCKQVKGFMFTSIIAITFILVVFCFIFFYENMYVVSTKPLFTPSSSGLFFGNENWQWYKAYDAIMFWSIFIWTLTFPTINYFVVKKQK